MTDAVYFASMSAISTNTQMLNIQTIKVCLVFYFTEGERVKLSQRDYLPPHKKNWVSHANEQNVSHSESPLKMNVSPINNLGLH